MREAELALDAEPRHEARPAVAQEAEQVEARLTENELEWPAAAVAPLARQGLGTTLPQAVGRASA
jgi:hypothetical protein